MTETVYVAVEGRVLAFTGPLPAGITARLGKDLRRVNEDGTPWAAGPLASPAKPAGTQKTTASAKTVKAPS